MTKNTTTTKAERKPELRTVAEIKRDIIRNPKPYDHPSWVELRKELASAPQPANAAHDWDNPAAAWSELERVKQQRDELLAALKNLIGKIEVMSGCMEVNYQAGHEECYPEFDEARVAIAKGRAS